MKRVVIAGTQSGVGKTTIATGLMALLARKGYRVQGYKAGPDYIDPGYHTAVTGRVSRNLDSWLLSDEAVLELFLRSAADADVAIVEGVMGLYDGYGGTCDRGSTAYLARLLKSPVLLVVDVRGTARSAAAMVLGYKSYDPELNLAGVILNRVGSPGHYMRAKEAIEAGTGVPVVGYLLRDGEIRLPERHLGLVPTAEGGLPGVVMERLVRRLDEGLDLEKLMTIAESAPELHASGRIFASSSSAPVVRIGVAWDKAFNFYYRDSLELLEAYGAELVYFSPLADDRLPAGLDGLLIGGGFPELYPAELEANSSMRESIRMALAEGLPAYAECGGLMYLAEEVVDFEGKGYRMVGAISVRAVMTRRMAGLGYRYGEALRDNILMRKGQTVKGHEFHWSRLESPNGGLTAAYRLWRDGEGESYHEGVVKGNILASYLHLHFCSCPELARNFVSSCLSYKTNRV